MGIDLQDLNKLSNATRPASLDIVIWVTACVLIFLLPHLGIFPMFTYSIPVMLLIAHVLKRSGENFSSIGLSFGKITFQAAWVGMLTGAGLFLFMQYIFFPLLKQIVPLAPADLKDFAAIRGNVPMYIFVVVIGWVVGGLYEEIAFHGFIFTRTEKILPGKHATAIAVLITSIVFGAYHYQLGVSGVINAFIAGLGYHLLMLRFQRNLWYSFFAHGTFDTMAISMIFLGYW